MPGIFGGGSDTQTTTQGTSFAPWTQAMQQGLAGIALGQTGGRLTDPGFDKAGFNLDQMKGFDLARQGVNQFGFGTPGALGGAKGYLDGGQMQAARLGGTDYQEYMNPFLQDVGRDVVDSLRREYDNNAAKMAARSASSVAFGGSGDALGQAQLARGFNQDATATVNQLLSGGFDRATAIADRQVDREQQARSQNANNSLTAANIYSNLFADDFNRGRTVMSDLLGVGNQQQQFAQGVLDAPRENLRYLAGFIPSIYDSTQIGTSPDNSPSTLQQLLGAGLTIGGMGTAGGGTLGGNFLSSLFGGGFPAAPIMPGNLLV